MAYGRITKKQTEILEYIKSQILNKGYPPSVRDICTAVNLKSTSSVHAHLETLEKNGYIRRDPTKPRAKDIRNCHINIGTGKEITIRELAGLIVNTVGYQGKLTFDSSKPDGTMRKLTDPSKLHNLGWHHKIDIEEGVQRMYEWYLG